MSVVTLQGYVAANQAFGDITATNLRVVDETDQTKQVVFSAANVSSNTVRTITLPDSDGTISSVGQRMYNPNATVAVDKIVKITGYNTTNDVPEFAIVTSVFDVAVGITDASFATLTSGTIVDEGLLQTTTLDTSASSVGAPVFFDGSGNLTLASLGSIQVGTVSYVNVVGQVFFNFKTLGSPTLTTPVLGTPASGDLSNCSAYPGDSSLVVSGALNSGSITSGFGTIDNGSSNINTTGQVSAGVLLAGTDQTVVYSTPGVSAFVAVKVNGINGAEPTVIAATTTTDDVIGLTTAVISATSSGTVITKGLVTTLAFDATGGSDGDPVYFDSSGVLTLVSGSPQVGVVVNNLNPAVIFVDISSNGKDVVADLFLTPLTSDTDQNFLITESGNGGGGAEGWKAFDRQITRWLSLPLYDIAGSYTDSESTTVSGNPTLGEWIQCEFPFDTYITKYSIIIHSSLNTPSEWTLAGSNDGTTWTLIDEVNGEYDGVLGLNFSTDDLILASAPGTYKYVRLIVESNWTSNPEAMANALVRDLHLYGRMSDNKDVRTISLHTTGNASVDGNLTVYGDTTNLMTSTVEMESAQIHLGSTNTSDISAIGFFGQYSSTNYTGFVRKGSAGDWHLVDDTTKPEDATNPATLNSGLLYARVPMGECYFDPNATATVIDTVSVWKKVAGTSTIGHTDNFTHSANRLTYTGSRNIMAHIGCTFSMTPATASEHFSFSIYKNDTKVGGSEIAVTASGLTDNVSSVIHTMTSMAPSDYIELWVKNIDTANNLTVTFMNLSAVGSSM